MYIISRSKYRYFRDLKTLLSFLFASVFLFCDLMALPSYSESISFDLAQRGQQLQLAITDIYAQNQFLRSAARRIDIGQTVAKYIPLGTTFADAETILRYGGFDLAPNPPRPNPNGPAGDPARFSIIGGKILKSSLSSKIQVIVVLSPATPGASDTTVSQVYAEIRYDTL